MGGAAMEVAKLGGPEPCKNRTIRGMLRSAYPAANGALSESGHPVRAAIRLSARKRWNTSPVGLFPAQDGRDMPFWLITS